MADQSGAPDAHEPTWTRRSSRIVYHGRRLITEHDVVLPGGQLGTYEVDESVPFAVAVLVVDSAGAVRVTRQFRYPIGRWIFDLPAGGGHEGESPDAAAARECEEETGLIPVELVPLHTFFQNPGGASWPTHVFLCTATTVGTASTDDPMEQVSTVSMPLEHLDDLIRRGQIVDPALLIGRTMAGLKGLLPTL